MIEKECSNCGAGFVAPVKTQAYCSGRCRKAAETRRARARGAAWTQRGPFVCQGCGITYHTKRRKGEGEQYCSRECAFSHKALKAMVAKHHEAHLRAGYRLQPCAAGCGSAGQLKYCSDACAEIVRSSLYRQRTRGKVVDCIVCGVKFCKVFGLRGSRDHCSAHCRSVALAESKRRGRLKRRAAGTVELVDPFEILRRDGWKCCACGCVTPRRLRGTKHPGAPEVDHIVPIALGGTSDAANLQTLCRTCNCLKGVMPMDEFLRAYLGVAA